MKSSVHRPHLVGWGSLCAGGAAARGARGAAPLAHRPRRHPLIPARSILLFPIVEPLSWPSFLPLETPTPAPRARTQPAPPARHAPRARGRRRGATAVRRACYILAGSGRVTLDTLLAAVRRTKLKCSDEEVGDMLRVPPSPPARPPSPCKTGVRCLPGVEAGVLAPKCRARCRRRASRARRGRNRSFLGTAARWSWTRRRSRAWWRARA